MSEKNRWFILKKLLDTIREKPITVNDIQGITDIKNGKPEKHFPQSRATIYNWLHDLETLGLIYNQNGLWCPIESKKPEYSTKNYELAVEHANRLLFSKNDVFVGVALHPMNYLMQLIVIEDKDVKEFLDHLKTGPNYQPIYGKIIEYQLTLTKRGKLLENINADVSKILVKDINSIWKNFSLNISALLTIKKKNNKQDVTTAENFQKIDAMCDTLLQEIAGELTSIFNQVAKGPNPLEGYCDSCSHLRVTIKE